MVRVIVNNRRDFNKVLRALKKKKLEQEKLKRISVILKAKRKINKRKKRK